MRHGLHQIHWLAGRVAGLDAVRDVVKLTVLKDLLCLDLTAPAACKDLLTFTTSVLGNSTCHIYPPYQCRYYYSQ